MDLYVMLTILLLILFILVAGVITCEGKWKYLWGLLRDWWWCRGKREILQHQHDSINDANDELQERIDKQREDISRQHEIIKQQCKNAALTPNLNRASTHALLDEVKSRIPRTPAGKPRVIIDDKLGPKSVELLANFCEIAGLDQGDQLSETDRMNYKYYCEGYALGYGDKE